MLCWTEEWNALWVSPPRSLHDNAAVWMLHTWVLCHACNPCSPTSLQSLNQDSKPLLMPYSCQLISHCFQLAIGCGQLEAAHMWYHFPTHIAPLHGAVSSDWLWISLASLNSIKEKSNSKKASPNSIKCRSVKHYNNEYPSDFHSPLSLTCFCFLARSKLVLLIMLWMALYSMACWACPVDEVP